jgi:hypothetical protein
MRRRIGGVLQVLPALRRAALLELCHILCAPTGRWVKGGVWHRLTKPELQREIRRVSAQRFLNTSVQRSLDTFERVHFLSTLESFAASLGQKAGGVEGE